MMKMEISVTDVPRCIKSFSFSPRVILSERNTVEYLIRMKEYIFGSRCRDAAEKLGIDLFDLVFINDRTFGECCNMYLKRVRDRDRDIIRTAFLLKKMYNGDYVRICDLKCENDKAYVKEPEHAYLNMLNDVADEQDKKKNFLSKFELKPSVKNSLNKKARIALEAVRLSAMKFGMKSAVQYKELIDKYNYRRFSTNLRFNNRPASVEQIEKLLTERKKKCLADLSNPKTRINFSALFAITYGGFTVYDLYSKNTVFDTAIFDKEKKLAVLAGDLIDIIYNGNGIEIANMFIHIITTFSKTELPPVDMSDLGSVMDNYSLYYAVATLASVCESVFKYNGLNGELRQYLKKHTLENYWNCMDRLMLMKRYSAVVSFCYTLSNFDADIYREDPEYQGEILYSFERAEKFSRELKDYEEEDVPALPS